LNSDGTVLHLATAEALISSWKTVDEWYKVVAKKYLESFQDMSGRNPGIQCGKAQPFLEKGQQFQCTVADSTPR